MSSLPHSSSSPLLPLSAADPLQPEPRKRRRRTVASGATDDCFTCRKRAVECDRKRPYCSQCIDIGKECSGYKTTLTWGVGVASRGKLRGLSCPVTAAGKSKGESAPVSKPHAPDRVAPVPLPRRRRKSSVSRLNARRQNVPSPAAMDIPPCTNSAYPYHPPVSASAPSHLHTHFFPTLPTINAAPRAWHHDHQRPTSLRLHSLQRIHTALDPQYDCQSTPHSASSLNSLADHELDSPSDYPLTPGSTIYRDYFTPTTSAAPTSYPLSSSVDSLSSHWNNSSVGSYPDTLSSSIDSLRSVLSFGFESSSMDTPTYAANPYPQDEALFSPLSDTPLNINPFDQIDFPFQDEEEESPNQSVLGLLDPRWSSPFFHMSPRLQSLMEYYDRHVCPYLISFDGPENPYRKHILPHALHNEGLQNAIAALATNNIRMRKQSPPKQIGFPEEIVRAFDGMSKVRYNEPTVEETCYKQMSIDQLNLQLTDPRAAHDDSVIATLLILCLFHVCDSGFSKFKIQLAGVQKLLSMRSPGAQSEFTQWVQMFFIWFDVMTSAVNDREMQVQGDTLDMLDYSSNLGALEQFSGCDGRLFKLIARLGRLNLLSQGRPVRSPNGAARPRTSQQIPRTPTRKRHEGMGSINSENLDSNGWTTCTNSSDDELGSADEEALKYKSTHLPDSRHEFWHEWTDIRSRLQSLQLDPFSRAPQPPPNMTNVHEYDVGQRDMVHINECFRYSALLYTERLGSPLLPSSHPSFQNLVSHSLFHITALGIDSCVNKFLLWPLFITGTECVDEGHRNIIRTRCVEVQRESGFWNNISGLDVLENVWSETGNHVRGMEAAELRSRQRDSEVGSFGQAFHWRKAMGRARVEDGYDYILL